MLVGQISGIDNLFQSKHPKIEQWAGNSSNNKLKEGQLEHHTPRTKKKIIVASSFAYCRDA